MPPAKSKAAHDGNGDSKSDGSTTKEKAVAAAAHARKAKAALHAQQQQREPNNGAGGIGGSRLRELALASTESGNVVGTAMPQSSRMSWPTAPLRILNRYRVAHQLPTPACFTTPYRQAVLTSPSGIGRRSPTMARRKDKRRVSRETLSTAVRKSFNAAAVSEIDVVVELAYRVRFGDKAFRLRSGPGLPKKP